MIQQDLATIKQISISQYLSRLGIEPINKTGRTLLYHAPYRTDNHPSFAVDTQKNTWYDFATGEGTSIIDIVMKMQNIDFKEAIKHLSGQNNITAQEHYPVATKEKEPGIVILKEKPLNNSALITYLQERCIDIPIAQKHCREIYYTAGGKRYFGIGFKNDAGGYEIRNKYFKGATSKDITTIHHKDVFTCHIYEGFLDYLSHLTIEKHNLSSKTGHSWPKINPSENIIILNSVTNINKAKDFLKNENQLMVTAYLDNDDAGRRAVKELRDFAHPYRPILDASICYQHHKDINDYLMSMGKQQKNSVTSKMKIS
ncbi:MAG: toprim domain-containing protein [Prevotellaceae bacterium]|jgi:hypothetical protein|nr:toprim domain-containing protein [Prevotellaceae bacterium]